MPSIDAGIDALRLPSNTPSDGARAADRTRRRRTRLTWGGCGFVLGMLVWHFVGFWSFVTTIVHRGPAASGAAESGEPAQRVARDAKRSARLSETAHGQSVAVARGALEAQTACTAFALDRRTGIPTAAACDPDGPQPRLVASSSRGDREFGDRGSVAGWTASIDTPVAGGN